MSAKLIKAIDSGKVRIRKLVTGEVLIQFKDRNLKSIPIHTNDVVDLTAYTNVRAQDCMYSNIDDLATRGMLDIIL